ncbi:MAG: hypothetical protein WC337_04025 [Candidatus Muiribacteriota bacterium]
MIKKQGFIHFIVIFFLGILLTAFFIANLKISSNRKRTDYIINSMKNSLELESSLHRAVSELMNQGGVSKKDIMKNSSLSVKYSDLKTTVNINHFSVSTYTPFLTDGNYFSDERKGYFHFDVSNKTKKIEVLIPYNYYRYSPPVSGDFALFLKNTPSNEEINPVLNNPVGNPINNFFPMRILSEQGKIFFGSERDNIVLNIAHGSGKYGEGFLLDERQLKNNILSFYKGAYSSLREDTAFTKYDFSDKHHYSSFFRLSGTNFEKYNPEILGRVFKAYFKVNAYNPHILEHNNPVLLPFNNIPENIPEEISANYKNFQSGREVKRYSENTFEKYEISKNSAHDKLLIRDVRNLNENSFFMVRVTEKSDDLAKFHQFESGNSILDLNKNIVFVDKRILYIPYIDMVREGGVIVVTGDVFIDTIINPLEKPLTIVTTGGRILIGNEVHASLISLSDTGRIEGTTNSAKKIYGNIITANMNIRSFRQGVTLKYNPVYSKPFYNLKIFDKSSAYLPDKIL